jgi:hypothetical protein
MVIGRVCLDDGRSVLGSLCEPAAVPGAAGITSRPIAPFLTGC